MRRQFVFFPSNSDVIDDKETIFAYLNTRISVEFSVERRHNMNVK
jgi:hypothetical protein